MTRARIVGLLVLAAGCTKWDQLERDCTVENGCIRPGGSGGSGGPTAPSPPTGVTATAGIREARVQWTAPANNGGSPLTGFTVSVGGTTLSMPADATATELTVTGLANGTQYTFAVQAVNAVGLSAAAPSNPVTTPAVTGPPTTVTTMRGDRQVTVSWQAPVNDTGYPITEYVVTSTPENQSVTATAPATSAVVTGLTNGRAYTFTVVARTMVGDSPPATSGAETPIGPPGAPTGVTASPGNASVDLQWSPPADNGGSPITAYLVTSIPDGGTAMTTGATMATVMGLVNATPYTFTVVARSAGGDSPPSAPSAPVTPRADLPGSPTIVGVTAGDRLVTVQWAAPSSNGGSAIVSYTVTASPGGASVTTPDGTTTVAMVTGLTNGTPYTFTVRATNMTGPGAASAPSMPVIPDVVPDAPTQVMATAGNGQATVQWTAPAPNGGTPVTRYTVVSSPDGRTAMTPDGTTTQATVTGLTNDTPYTFTVRAENAFGPGPASAASSAVVPMAPPTMPQGLDASDGTSPAHVRLTWSGVPNATGYKVYRDGAFVMTVATSPFDDTGASPGGLPTVTNLAAQNLDDRVRLTWTNTTPAGATHSYTVVATNNGGDSAPSVANTGFRGPFPVTLAEVQIDSAPFAPTTALAQHDDTAAAPAMLIRGAATASDGAALGVVSLVLAGASGIDGPQYDYAVRLTSGAGTGPTSSTVQGRRLLGTLAYQWQRTDSDSPSGTYSSLPGVTSVMADDAQAPLDGSARYYRCEVSAPGASVSVFSIADRGFALALSTQPRLDGWTTDGVINAMVLNDAGTLFVGGDFTTVMPHVGAFAVFGDLTDAGVVVEPSRARLEHNVYAIEPDGAGGWYVGGDFRTIDSAPSGSLVHVTAAGAIDGAFNPAPNGPVRALRRSGTVLYAGGDFTSIGGQSRNRIAALDLTTGAATAWNPDANARVRALRVVGSTVYAGGDFGTIGGGTRAFAASLSASTGLLQAGWAPAVNGAVHAIAVSGTSVYLGGSFSAPRAFFAGVNDTTGAVLGTWAAYTDGTVYAVEVSGTRVLAGGSFTQICDSMFCLMGGAADCSSSGATCSAYSVTGSVRAIAGAGAQGAWFGGSFTSFGVHQRRNIAATGSGCCQGDAAWNAGANGEVHALAISGGVLAAGGAFSGFERGGLRRAALAAFDGAGALTAWSAPTLSGGPAPAGTPVVNALALHQDTLYVGGDFNNPRQRLTAFNALTGGTVWSAGATTNGPVDALLVLNDTLYVGGRFTGTSPRNRLAAYALPSRSLSAWDPSPNGDVYALAASPANTLYVGGAFTVISGAMLNRAAELPAGTAITPTSFNPNVSGSVRAIAPAGPVVYLGGGFSMVGGQPRQSVAGVSATTGAVTPLAVPVSGGSVRALAVSGRNLWVGGDFTTAAGQPRQALIALDLPGAALNPVWAPSANLVAPAGTVNALFFDGARLHVGGDFTSLGARVRGDLAVFPAQ